MITNLFKLHRFKVATIVVLATLFIYILITAFKVGGENFVTLIGNLIPVIFCLFASLLFLSAWINAGNSVSKRIWGAMGLGLSFGVWVSGFAWEQTGKFTGATLVFQTLPGAQHQNITPLNSEQEMLVEHALSVSGTQEQEHIQTLQTYFIDHIGLLHSLIDQFSGARIANGLIEQINRRSARDNWRIVMTEGKITLSDEYGSRDLGIYFSELLKVAYSYALNYVGMNVIKEEKRRLNAQLGKEVQKSVDKFIIIDNF